VFRLPQRRSTRLALQRLDELAQRVERLEGNQARIQTDVTVELQRADVAVEDLVAALESVRARVEALETPR
jgi:hypothetical protein